MWTVNLRNVFGRAVLLLLLIPYLIFLRVLGPVEGVHLDLPALTQLSKHIIGPIRGGYYNLTWR